jgi:hypothetical protein
MELQTMIPQLQTPERSDVQHTSPPTTPLASGSLNSLATTRLKFDDGTTIAALPCGFPYSIS